MCEHDRLNCVWHAVLHHVPHLKVHLWCAVNKNDDQPESALAVHLSLPSGSPLQTQALTHAPCTCVHYVVCDCGEDMNVCVPLMCILHVHICVNARVDLQVQYNTKECLSACMCVRMSTCMGVHSYLHVSMDTHGHTHLPHSPLSMRRTNRSLSLRRRSFSSCMSRTLICRHTSSCNCISSVPAHSIVIVWTKY